MGETKTITPDLKAPMYPGGVRHQECRRGGPTAWLSAPRGARLGPGRGETRRHRRPPTVEKAVTHLSAENRHLKEILGEKDLEIAILHDLLKKLPGAEAR